VTIPAGATSTTFAGNTSATSSSTMVNISASYAGVTQTGALSVTPALSGTPAGTYTLTVTGAAGSLSHNSTVTLVVN
jgi:hypothetical protein